MKKTITLILEIIEIIKKIFLNQKDGINESKNIKKSKVVNVQQSGIMNNQQNNFNL